MTETARRALVETLWREWIRDPRVLDAMLRVPRERFIAAEFQDRAYENEPLPIGEEQTISQPFVVALMLESLRLRGTERVLEIGTGSGYQTALLAELTAEVISVERSAVLAKRAAALLVALGYQRVRLHHADGSLGWPPNAPYQGIVVSAGAPSVPDALLHQLADGGRLVIPVGPSDGQELILLERNPNGMRRVTLGAVRFVPLVGAAAWSAPFPDGATHS